jgi:hypothetical protein
MLAPVAAACALLAAACATPDEGFQPKTPKVKAKRGIAAGSADDRSRCEWKGRQDREASETAGSGSITPNIRRVYQVTGMGEERRKVLVCREIDTNFDGIKDVVRWYNDHGESLHEEADSNYDGRIDTWITFTKGHLAEVRTDSNGDGRPDEWKSYSSGKLARIKRDQNGDGRPDTWEIYQDGKLERMGVDLDGDERVDRWDHDNELRRKLDEAERKKEAEQAAAEAAKKAAAARQAAQDAEDDAAGAAKEKGAAESPTKKSAAEPAGSTK